MLDPLGFFVPDGSPMLVRPAGSRAGLTRVRRQPRTRVSSSEAPAAVTTTAAAAAGAAARHDFFLCEQKN